MGLEDEVSEPVGVVELLQRVMEEAGLNNVHRYGCAKLKKDTNYTSDCPGCDAERYLSEHLSGAAQPAQGGEPWSLSDTAPCSVCSAPVPLLCVRHRPEPLQPTPRQPVTCLEPDCDNEIAGWCPEHREQWAPSERERKLEMALRNYRTNLHNHTHCKLFPATDQRCGTCRDADVLLAPAPPAPAAPASPASRWWDLSCGCVVTVTGAEITQTFCKEHALNAQEQRTVVEPAPPKGPTLPLGHRFEQASMEPGCTCGQPSAAHLPAEPALHQPSSCPCSGDAELVRAGCACDCHKRAEPAPQEPKR